ncbi:2-keto-4-pentenoate hydratase [Actinoplanes sp. NPDC051494]|uniref:2-keto-4-pentenoate hydratase n=1 Tax=Actinoplanes sp. NPDC051494 TaxID=3363907 RepID=UPI0037982BF1
MTSVRAAADELRVARLDRVARAPFTDTDPSLDESWGYAVQDLDRARRVAAGERVVGAKLGLTSRAKQVTIGVHQPIVGFLTDAMDAGAGAGVLSRTGQPRIEPEIAFRLGAALDRPLTFEDVGDVVDGVAVAMEIIDSRFAGFRFRPADVLADNTSAAGFLTGPWIPPARAGDLAAAGCVFSVDGEVAGTATGAAILGHPLRALVHLAEHLARRGEMLPVGSVVLAGAFTDAVPVRPGATYRVRIDGFGSLTWS